MQANIRNNVITAKVGRGHPAKGLRDMVLTARMANPADSVHPADRVHPARVRPARVRPARVRPAPRPDFDTTQPQSNANAIGLRPPGKGPRREGGFGGQKGPGPRPAQRSNINFDENQPHSNANASPFGRTTLTVPGGVPRGAPEGGFGHRGNRSGPRGRPGAGGQGKGHGGPPGGGPPRGKPHKSKRQGGEADGNVAPREANADRASRAEVNGNVAPPPKAVPRDDDE